MTLASNLSEGSRDVVPLVSDYARVVVLTVNNGFIIPLLALFGMLTNIANIVVFLRLGFNDTINISLFSMAVVDFLAVLFYEAGSTCVNPFVVSSGIPFPILTQFYDMFLSVHVCFSKISGFLTGFVAFERCLCVTMPLQVKAFITKKTTICVIASISVTVISFSSQAFSNPHKVGWRFDPNLNRTTLELIRKDDAAINHRIVFLFHIVTGYGSFIAVAACSVVLVRIISQQSRWRLKTSAPGGGQEKTSAASVGGQQDKKYVKDRRVVIIVTWLAAIYIACSAPVLVVAMVSAILGNHERQFNLYLIAGSCLGMLNIINASFNLFVYLRLNDKFRVTFRSLLNLKSV